MSRELFDELRQVMKGIDRPGSFCVSGKAPVVLPGLEVKGLGSIGLPLSTAQAKALKKLCVQAPYGKGEETIVDTKVRRVLLMKPEGFTLTNPEWESFLATTVKKVQEELGLESQKLDWHLYDLLLYEPGSFFLPHRDGEKLDRMVATLVIVLPSTFEGGELVVRHEGQEQTIDSGGGAADAFHIHYAAFYADCEHEVRPLRSGYRLCLVYNLTLKKGKKGLAAPRTTKAIEWTTDILRRWGEEEDPGKVVVTLEHQYTQEGLAWDALKGVDRARARVLLEASRQANCHAYLALLTFHESGSAEYSGSGRRGGSRRGYWSRGGDWDDEGDADDYVMGEVFDSDLSAEHWSDSSGNRLPFGEIAVEKEELLDPEALEAVDPEVEFEGYTGNAGMTLDHWYRHGAIFLWPEKAHFDVLCDAGVTNAIVGLQQMVESWEKTTAKNAPALRDQCVAFASAIIASWPESTYSYGTIGGAKEDPFITLLQKIDDPGLIRGYITNVLGRNASVTPGKSLVAVCKKHGWQTFKPELEQLFVQTNANTFRRNLLLLESVTQARPAQKKEWLDLCATLARALLQSLETIDRHKPAPHEFNVPRLDRETIFLPLVRSLLALSQEELTARLLDRIPSLPEKYPMRSLQVPTVIELKPWLEKQVKNPSAALARWVASCRAHLEAVTAQAPEAPADFRRETLVSCHCKDCNELNQFLKNPQEKEHRFQRIQSGRSHLEEKIRFHHCDLKCRTETTRPSHTLVCTKTTASHLAREKTYQQDLEHLAAVRAIEGRLPT